MNWDKQFTTWIGSKSSVILHTIFFVAMFLLPFLGIETDKVLLVLTTIVSLEAIYLAIFIQMTVNRHTESLKEVEEDIGEIAEDVGEISHDVEEMSEEVGEISEDIEEIQADVDELQEDVEKVDNNKKTGSVEDDKMNLDKIRETLNKLLVEVEKMKK